MKKKLIKFKLIYIETKIFDVRIIRVISDDKIKEKQINEQKNQI